MLQREPPAGGTAGRGESITCGAPAGTQQGWQVMNWYLAVLRNYTGFSGRASRTEFWMWTLVNFIVGVVLYLLSLAVHPLLILVIVYDLGVLIPGLAVSFRRLHDTDRTAWWLLIYLIPIIGAIVLLVFFCIDSTPGDNHYGASPKGLAPA